MEYIVQDGGSKDGSKEVLERYAGRLSRLAIERDAGQADAINRGFVHATGSIMAWLNSDDLMMPGTLHFVASYFERHPSVDVIYSHRILVDEHDQEIGRWVLPGDDAGALSYMDFIPQETLFWRRSAWERAGGRIDTSFRFAMDWDFLVRLRDTGAVFRRVPRFLGAFRVHQGQKTQTELDTVGASEAARIRARAGAKPGRWPLASRYALFAARHKIHVLARAFTPWKN